MNNIKSIIINDDQYTEDRYKIEDEGCKDLNVTAINMAGYEFYTQTGYCRDVTPPTYSDLTIEGVSFPGSQDVEVNIKKVTDNVSGIKEVSYNHSIDTENKDNKTPDSDGHVRDDSEGAWNKVNGLEGSLSWTPNPIKYTYSRKYSRETNILRPLWIKLKDVAGNELTDDKGDIPKETYEYYKICSQTKNGAVSGDWGACTCNSATNEGEKTRTKVTQLVDKYVDDSNLVAQGSINCGTNSVVETESCNAANCGVIPEVEVRIYKRKYDGTNYTGSYGSWSGHLWKQSYIGENKHIYYDRWWKSGSDFTNAYISPYGFNIELLFSPKLKTYLSDRKSVV